MNLLTFIAIFHVVIALFLIILVLLQDSKGGAMGMLGGGGGGNTVFGSTGAGNFLTTATKWVAIIFAATCIILAYMTTKKDTSVLDDYVPAAASTQQNAIEGVESKADEAKKEKTQPEPSQEKNTQ